MTTAKQTEKKTGRKKPGLRSGELPRSGRADTMPDDVVPFRPVLGPETNWLLRMLAVKYKASMIATGLQIVQKYAKSKAASAPLASFFEEEWLDIQTELGSPGLVGTLFLWKKRDYDSLKALAWDERWYVAGKMSTMLRMMIWHTAVMEGIKPAKFLADFAKQAEKAKIREDRVAKKKAAREKRADEG